MCRGTGTGTAEGSADRPDTMGNSRPGCPIRPCSRVTSLLISTTARSAGPHTAGQHSVSASREFVLAPANSAATSRATVSRTSAPPSAELSGARGRTSPAHPWRVPGRPTPRHRGVRGGDHIDPVAGAQQPHRLHIRDPHRSRDRPHLLHVRLSARAARAAASERSSAPAAAPGPPAPDAANAAAVTASPAAMARLRRSSALRSRCPPPRTRSGSNAGTPQGAGAAATGAGTGTGGKGGGSEGRLIRAREDGIDDEDRAEAEVDEECEEEREDERDMATTTCREEFLLATPHDPRPARNPAEACGQLPECE